MDWENVRFFLAVARAGTLAGAGRALNVKHSTVLRRIGSLEDSLGIKLFERHPTGYFLNEAGREMLERLSVVETDLAEIERAMSGRDMRLSGTVRIATVPALAPWICEALVAFRALHPNIALEMDASSEVLSLPRYEADIAIRVTRKPTDSLVGRRIATLAHGVYAGASHPAASTTNPDLTTYDWVSHEQSRADTPQARWIAQHVPAERIVFRTNTTDLLKTSIRLGMGLTVLPCYLGDTDPSLRRLRLIRGLGAELWLLTHRDLKDTPRVKVLVSHLATRLAQHRPLIEGNQPNMPS